MRNMTYDYEDDYEDEVDNWSEMSSERSSFETDEDYQDRMQSLYGDDWNF
ncbi:MAG TPA: hypothetical protein H9977_04985 [Candidatus Parabacteroides intestinipullorum]|uniref:Uncharacterized protein n=1 Tax=Candidatus Parabacteroides intestinipullorum TaxID=2838723 RepID=A0A9D1X8A5_9BACT|nr:hypothetical protein [Candidatus Parabacteroides intestinipullorum]